MDREGGHVSTLVSTKLLLLPLTFIIFVNIIIGVTIIINIIIGITIFVNIIIGIINLIINIIAKTMITNCYKSAWYTITPIESELISETLSDKR